MISFEKLKKNTPKVRLWKLIRMYHGMSAREFGKFVFVSKSCIDQYEGGLRAIPDTRFAVVCNQIDVSMEELTVLEVLTSIETLTIDDVKSAIKAVTSDKAYRLIGWYYDVWKTHQQLCLMR